MAAVKVNLAIEQGATFVRLFRWLAGKPAVPVDLTGCVARMQIRDTVESPDVLFALSSAAGEGITLGGTAGTITIRIEATNTETFEWSRGVYDLEIEFADGTVRRLVRGSVSVSLEVTRV